MTTAQAQGNAGDLEEDFARIYEQFKRPIRAYIYHLVGNNDQADDLTQDTFIKAYRALPLMAASPHLAPWLYRIATNTAFDALRRRKRIAWIPWRAVEFGVGEDPQERYEDGRTERVRFVLAQLPHRYRVPLLLFLQRGLSYREIAQALDMSVETVRTRLYRARRLFRACYLERVRQEESAEQNVAGKLLLYPTEAEASPGRDHVAPPVARTRSALVGAIA